MPAKNSGEKRRGGTKAPVNTVSGLHGFVTDTAITSGAVDEREAVKLRKHRQAYAAQTLGFVPLVASTRGVLGDHFVRYLWVLSDVATRGCSVDLADLQLQRSRLFRRRLAAVSAAALGVGTARLLRRRVCSLPTRARSRLDRKSTRLNSSHSQQSRMPSSA